MSDPRLARPYGAASAFLAGPLGTFVSPGDLEGFWVFVVGTAALLLLAGALLVFLFIHDRRMEKAERDRLEALAATAAQYQALADHSPDLILRLDAKGAIVLANARAAAQFGSGALSIEPWKGLARKVLEERRPVADEVRVGAGMDLRIFEVRAIPEPIGPIGPGGATALLLGRDLTRERELQAQLHQSQKLEALGTLVGGVSHDFNNLLMAVLGAAQVLQLRKEDLSETQARSIDVILDAARRGRDVVSQLMNFSRRTELQRIPHTLDVLLREAEGLFNVALGDRSRQVRLIWSPRPSLESLRLDPGQMGQALLNLVVNARDAIEGEGRITLSTGQDFLDDGRALALGVPPGSYQFVSVEDTGRGLPPELLPRIFEPFFTTKAPGEGTGLGLAVVHGIAKSHGGAVEVRSAEGQGTDFRIWLPEA
ncbi:MAG: PAS domain-containing protein [Holophagaceae bacterium]|nr:PAS domain-containing protein [Holophagaceae bacterium]